MPTTQLQMLLAVVVGAFVIAAIVGLNARDLPLRRALAITGITFIVCTLSGVVFVLNR